MTIFEQYSDRAKWVMPLLLTTAIAGCGGKSPVLGTGVTQDLAPSVVASSPADQAANVAVYQPVISVTFSEPMAPLVNGSDFIVSCVSPCVNPEGSLALDASNTKATFTPAANLAALTPYTVKVVGVKSLVKGIALEQPFTTQFTTGPAPVALSVTGVTPLNNATVAVNQSAFTAMFNEPILPLNEATDFDLTCVLPCINPNGAAVLDSSNKLVTLSLANGTTLLPLTTYTARVAGHRSLATGAALAMPVSWKFTTGNTPDKTRPTVVSSVPATSQPGPTLGVPVNAAISAAFSEAMAPASVSASNFSLTCAAPCMNPTGSVSYDQGTKSLVYIPAAPLMVDTVYTATIAMAATDLAGNTLAGNQAASPAASDYVWLFTTAAAVAATPVSVSSTSPMADAMNVCTTDPVNGTFNTRMDPSTVNATTFRVTESLAPMTPVVAASVSLDANTGRIATFSPLNDLVAGKSYTATLKGGSNGVKDLAIPANAMATDVVWSFTANSCVVTPPVAIPLGAATTFGSFGGSAGTTNQGIKTIVNGDIGTTAVSTSVTGFHDGGVGCTYTETTLNIGTVNGNIFTSAPPPTVGCPTEGTATTAAIAAAARADALTAYNALVAKPGGADPGAGNLANLVLAPAVYTAVAGSFKIEGGDLTLDAQGNANAVWVFQMASTLTVGGPGAAAPQSVVLVNGAQAKNVFWQVGTAATINAGGGGTMVGTIISQAGAAISTDGNAAVTTLNGRVLSLNASVTMVNTVINVPAP